MQALLKLVVSKVFFTAAPVVEDASSTGRVILEGIAKLTDNVPRRRKGSFAVDGSSYKNISDLRRNTYFITHRVLMSSRAPLLLSGSLLVTTAYSSAPLRRSP